MGKLYNDAGVAAVPTMAGRWTDFYADVVGAIRENRPAVVTSADAAGGGGAGGGV